jgi:hypothetical protein
MKFKIKLLLLSSFSLAAASIPSAAIAQTCENLAAFALPHATITATQSVTGGSFTPPGATVAETGWRFSAFFR